MPTLPGMEGMALNPLDVAQVRSAQAKAVFEGRHDGDPDWLLYWDLVAEGWPWRKAAYIAWAIVPRDRRAPDTEQRFAVQELGLTSARKIREWKSDPDFIGFIRDTARNEMAAARLEIWRALMESASNPNPRNHADRKTALEILGDYRETIRVGPELPEDLSELSVAEKRARLEELRRQSRAE